MLDAFISHASEDKEKLVRPLAKQLKEVYKVDIWYDEFSLEYGDSLIESIEKGLQDSSFGVIVFSKNFFKKVWTNHEFKSLRTKEMLLNKKVIIPIWYNITKEEIAKFSLKLADNVAIKVGEDVDINEIAVNIVKIIRPDIYNNIIRMNTYERILKDSDKVTISLKDVEKIKPPIRHDKVSTFVKARLKLIYNAIKDVDDRNYEKYEEDFRRNINIDRELIITELITAAYIDCVNKKQLSFNEKLYIYYITLSLGEVNNANIPLDPKDIEEYVKITKNYLQNIDATPMIEFRFQNK